MKGIGSSPATWRRVNIYSGRYRVFLPKIKKKKFCEINFVEIETKRKQMVPLTVYTYMVDK